MSEPSRTPSKRQLALLKKGLGSLYMLKCNGAYDPEEQISILDIEGFLNSRGPGSLTPKQRRVFDLVILDGLTECEVGQTLGTSQQAVCYCLKAALTKIYRHIRDPRDKPKGPVFDPIERQMVLDLYHDGLSYKEIAIETKKSLKSVRNKIRDMRERGEVDVKRRAEAVKVRKDSEAEGPSGG